MAILVIGSSSAFIIHPTTGSTPSTMIGGTGVTTTIGRVGTGIPTGIGIRGGIMVGIIQGGITLTGITMDIITPIIITVLTTGIIRGQGTSVRLEALAQHEADIPGELVPRITHHQFQELERKAQQEEAILVVEQPLTELAVERTAIPQLALAVLEEGHELKVTKVEAEREVAVARVVMAKRMVLQKGEAVMLSRMN